MSILRGVSRRNVTRIISLLVISVAIAGCTASGQQRPPATATPSFSARSSQPEPTRSSAPLGATTLSATAAWRIAQAPLLAADNVSYDTVVTSKLPGTASREARIVVAERVDIEHGIAEQLTYGDIVAPNTRPQHYTAKLFTVKGGTTDIVIRNGDEAAELIQLRNHKSALNLLPVDIASPDRVPITLRGFTPRSITSEYGRLCIKGDLPAAAGLLALGFGRVIRTTPKLRDELLGRITATIRLHDDGTIEKVEVSGNGHTITRQRAGILDSELTSAIAESTSVTEMGTYNIRMKIERP